MNDIKNLLKEKGITPTPIRILVYRCLDSALTPLSLSDMEINLDSIDKSTISRTLNLFKSNHLIHSFNDGSGSVKYEICKSHDHLKHDDSHVHFRCEVCGSTICLISTQIPTVDLPGGYEPHEVSYIITGICPACSNQK